MLLKKTLFAVAAGLAVMASANAQIKVGVVTSATGPVSLVGIPQKNTIALLPKEIGGEKVEYIAFDDASDPAQTVTVVKKLISEEKIDVLFGPSSSPSGMAIIDFVAEAKLPTLAPVGTTAVVSPMDDKRRWVFKTTQNDILVANKLFDHMKANGVKKIGFIGTGDTFGETWYKVSSEAAKERGIEIIANERFKRPDTSVTGQALRILSAKPDAVLIAAPGGPAVLPQSTLVDMNYKGQIYQTHGAALNEFIKLGGKKVEGTILGGSVMLVPNEVPESNPSKKVAIDYINTYKAAHGNEPATFGGNMMDAGILLQAAAPAALKVAKPGTEEFRAALRDALEKIKEVPGTQGVYNMTPEDHSGFDHRGVELVTIKDGQWALAK